LKERFSYYRWLRRSIRDLLCIVFIYVVIAYLILPAAWRHYENEPALETAPKTTESSFGLPGDPLNVALVGTKEELVSALLRAGWVPADATTVRSSVSIATSILFHRSYPTAPMSNLYLWNRKQDLAFERLTGRAPTQRHHVRFWLSPLTTKDGRPLWVGAASYDFSIGFNHFTGQLTHHIAPDIDAERQDLMSEIQAQGQLVQISQVTGVGANFAGRNAQGDWYFTDGELTIGMLSPHNTIRSVPPEILRNPAPIDWKNLGWQFLRSILSPHTA
jgi:hypothetical protein